VGLKAENQKQPIHDATKRVLISRLK